MIAVFFVNTILGSNFRYSSRETKEKTPCEEPILFDLETISNFKHFDFSLILNEQVGFTGSDDKLPLKRPNPRGRSESSYSLLSQEFRKGGDFHRARSTDSNKSDFGEEPFDDLDDYSSLPFSLAEDLLGLGSCLEYIADFTTSSYSEVDGEVQEFDENSTIDKKVPYYPAWIRMGPSYGNFFTRSATVAFTQQFIIQNALRPSLRGSTKETQETP
jgi:hypothetical protein